MGLFDAIKSRLGAENHNENVNDDEYYEDQEYYDAESIESYDNEEYYDDAGDLVGASGRKSSVFNTYTPLVSMSDVRSQELPRYESSSSSLRAQQAAPQIRTSLPYVGGSSDDRGSQSARGYGRAGDSASYNTGSLGVVEQNTAALYAADTSVDPLLRRHSLSNTGDFSATSPAYYASRSGVGHVRQSGEARRVQKFREIIVVNPKSYAEAEQVAVNLRRGNAVVLVLTQTRPELAKRILDFSFGAAAVAEGQVVSVAERIYALTCDYSLTNTEMESLQSRGVL